MTEHEHQKLVVAFCGKYPELSGIFAIPNGGMRDLGTAIKLKAEGVKKGVPDLFLPLAKKGFNGLFIEMKAIGGKVAKEQKQWHQDLSERGYLVAVCYGYQEAISELKNYVGMN